MDRWGLLGVSVVGVLGLACAAFPREMLRIFSWQRPINLRTVSRVRTVGMIAVAATMVWVFLR